MQIVQIQQGTPEWHAWRQGGIGSSDMPVLFGVSRFKTKHQLWLEKQGLAKKDTSNGYIKARGHVHEKTLRAYAEEIIEEPLAVTCIQGERPWQRVSLDGISSDAKIVVEAKMMKAEDFIALRDQHIVPKEYVPQCAHQIASAEAETCLFVGLNEKMGERAHVFLPRDCSTIRAIDTVPVGDSFWKLVEAGEEPEPEGDEIITITDDALIAVANEFRVAKEYKEKYEAEMKDKAAKLQAALGEGKRAALIGELRLTRYFKKGNVDYSRIPQLDGVDLNAFRKKGGDQYRITSTTQGAK